MIALHFKVKIMYYFPIRGHNYMPADRAFGRVEEILRKKETILLPEEYYAAFRKVGNVKVYGDDWDVYVF